MNQLNLSAGKHCRACLQPSDFQMYSLASEDVSIEDNDQTHVEKKNLAEIYNVCTQLLYEQSNPNWELICRNCFVKLIEFFEFRKMCIESYKKIQEIDSLGCRQIDDNEMSFKVEVVDVAHILETQLDTNVVDNDNTEHEDGTSNSTEKIKHDSDESDMRDDTIDGTTKTRSGRNRAYKKECDEHIDMESRDCNDDDDDDEDNDDDDDDYDANDDENDSEDDDFEDSTTVEDKIEIPNESKKSKNSTTTKKPSSSEWNHVCDVCSKKFFKKHRYDAHMRKHLGLKQWKCDHCDRAFEKYTSLTLHVAAKHYGDGEKPIFTCDIDGCDKSYTMKESLRVHIRNVHDGKKPIVTARMCEQCGKSFNSNAALVRHSYTHTKETPFKCDVCSKMFATKYKLKEHTMRHDGIKNFVCPTCGLRKTTGHELRVHMKYHNEDIQFPCNLCSLIFTRQANMKRHQRVVHCGVKAFPCPHCDRSFGKSETLKHHVMTHTGERPLSCSICDKRFIQPIALKTHMKTHNKTK